jgi:putative phosphoribosyl transferase
MRRRRTRQSYPDRTTAGRELAAALEELHLDDPVVLALPRGGVPVGRAVADELGAPLDVLLVRKVGAPGHPELGLGAVGEDGVTVLDDDRVRAVGADRDQVLQTAERERAEVERRAQTYRGAEPAEDLSGRQVVLVDDGIATGGSAAAAVEVARQRGAAKVVVAVPVAPPSGVERLAEVADEVVCPWQAEGRFAVGLFYDDFHQLDDDEVVRLLRTGAGGGERG